MKNSQFLTNEYLKKKFPSNFDLVNYAIMLSKQKVEGEEEIPKLGELITYLSTLPDIQEESQDLA
ncbi:MAG: hypothetical protein JW769_05525 [Parachlamydiales bacterium]|nr:hypothetical protein [Parachlamydiales bacterium]